MQPKTVHPQTERSSNTASHQTTDANRKGASSAPPSYGIDYLDRQKEQSPTSSCQPTNLKVDTGNLSGLSINTEPPHYNSSKPAQLQALAYTQGTDIHVGGGQPTMQITGKRRDAAFGANIFRNPATDTRTGLGLQCKLSVGAVNDPLEAEADTLADHVMRMPDTPLQRKCAKCEEEDKRLHRKPLASQLTPTSQASAAPVSDALASRIESSHGGGSPLPDTTLNFMESRFDADFSDVKIHADSGAAQINHELNAKAFTIGKDIYFNEGQYQPNSDSGKHLLAHELAHTVQQKGVIRRIPKDRNGRPLGFFPTPEQEAYDKETYEIKEWKKVLARFDKGELDDRDLANGRLRNRLTGLTTAEINALMTKIKDYQQKNPAIDTTKILEWLEVRKEISTPMPDGAVVNRDPITDTVKSYSLMVNNIRVTVVSDAFGNAQNDTGPTTNFGKHYTWSHTNNIIDKLTNKDTGSDINPATFEVTIVTGYHGDPNAQSAYGKGTTTYDKEENTQTLRVHEGKHGTDYIDYLRSNAFPVDIAKGIVGVVSADDMRKIDRYIANITKASCEETDQSGLSQDEYLQTPEGKRSGMKSCRTR